MVNEKKASKLAKKLRKEYTDEQGQLQDGNLSNAMIDFIGDGISPEDAAWDALFLMRTVAKQYKTNEGFRKAVDMATGWNGTPAKFRLKRIKNFFGDIFNENFGGYMQMLRIEKNPATDIGEEIWMCESKYLGIDHEE